MSRGKTAQLCKEFSRLTVSIEISVIEESPGTGLSYLLPKEAVICWMQVKWDNCPDSASCGGIAWYRHFYNSIDRNDFLCVKGMDRRKSLDRGCSYSQDIHCKHYNNVEISQISVTNGDLNHSNLEVCQPLIATSTY